MIEKKDIKEETKKVLKFKSKQEAIRFLSKSAKGNWSKKYLKEFLKDCDVDFSTHFND